MQFIHNSNKQRFNSQVGSFEATLNAWEDNENHIMLHLVNDVSTLSPTTDPLEVSYVPGRDGVGGMVTQPQFLVDMPINVGCFARIRDGVTGATTNQGSPVMCLTHCLGQGERCATTWIFDQSNIL